MWESVIQPGVAVAIALGLGHEVRSMRKTMETGFASVASRMDTLEDRVATLEKPRFGPSVRGFAAKAATTLGVFALLALGCQPGAKGVETPEAVHPRDARVFIHMTGDEGEGYATGWYIATDGTNSVIATAGHVCERDYVYGIASDLDHLEDEVPAYDFYDLDRAPSADICLLSIAQGAPAVLPIASESPLPDSVIRYSGFPDGVAGSYSGTVEEVADDGTILANIPGYFGASGSAVVNEAGEVVGILSMGDMRFQNHVWLTGTREVNLAKIVADAYLWAH